MSASSGTTLEAQDVRLVQSTWKEVKVKEPDMDAYVHTILFKYIEKNPNMKYVFKSICDKSLEEVKVSAEFKQHSENFASSLDLVVQSITTGEQDHELCTTIRDLGAKHAALGIRAAHYTPVGEILVSSLTETLGALFTEEVLSAWTHVYQLVVELMTYEETRVNGTDVTDVTDPTIANIPLPEPASIST